tara:strand:- start:296 stop:487 length:192 start_codon:yes stop_codon:yes gene_type:complete
MTVTPAYGRDYKSAKAAKAAWKSGKDFIIRDFFSPYDGKPCSIRDTQGQVTIRYDKLRKVTQA